MDNILREHYLVFCSDVFDEGKFTEWALGLSGEDLAIILQAWGLFE